MTVTGWKKTSVSMIYGCLLSIICVTIPPAPEPSQFDSEKGAVNHNMAGFEAIIRDLEYMSLIAEKAALRVWI